jgi:hypothetical protein
MLRPFVLISIKLMMNALAGLIFAVLTFTDSYSAAKLSKLVRPDLLIMLATATSLTLVATVSGALSILTHSKRVRISKSF